MSRITTITIYKNSKVLAGESLDKWMREKLSAVFSQKISQNICPCTFQFFFKLRINSFIGFTAKLCNSLKDKASKNYKLCLHICKSINSNALKLFISKIYRKFITHRNLKGF